ncbi:MAG: hypothetical protein R2681_01760 [Pyrinomonadaceae bacterium]
MKTETPEHFGYCRTFLVDDLPGQMTPADPHLQIFDNYIENTMIRLREVRDPKTKLWERCLEKRIVSEDPVFRFRRISSIELDETEYGLFRSFKGREIRKNRYFYDEGDLNLKIDIFLGKLWGLSIARVDFRSIDAVRGFTPVEYLGIETTQNRFFDGENLVSCEFSDVQREYRKMAGD